MIKSDFNGNCCHNCATTNCFIKKYCSEESSALINRYVETSVYRKNQFIAHEGNSVLGLFFIQNGKVKVISSGLGGKTHIVRLTKEGDIIGHRGYGGDRYPISAIALEDSTVCFVNNNIMYETFMENPKLTYALMMYYSRELRISESKIKNHSQMNVREKVADALLYCNSIFNQNNKYPFLLQLNRQDIAELAGINTEQLSRILTEFKKDKFISVSKNEIEINNQESLKEITSPFGVVELFFK